MTWFGAGVSGISEEKMPSKERLSCAGGYSNLIRRSGGRHREGAEGGQSRQRQGMDFRLPVGAGQTLSEKAAYFGGSSAGRVREE